MYETEMNGTSIDFLDRTEKYSDSHIEGSSIVTIELWPERFLRT